MKFRTLSAPHVHPGCFQVHILSIRHCFVSNEKDSKSDDKVRFLGKYNIIKMQSKHTQLHDLKVKKV